ncbi:MAG: Crp/Fnr family transcriptional regulator [Chloroflexota bacterium]|nr:MAG: Crp/Fnr family transcriptional regulator [Chloroflexota bacterium]
MADSNSDALARWLTAVPLFQQLSHAELLQLAQMGKRRAAARDEFFFQQGDSAEFLYLLELGQVRMTQLTPDGEQVILRYIRPQDMFGGIAAFTFKSYPATAQALEDSRALLWDAVAVRELMRSVPQLALNVMDHAAETIIQLQDRVRELQTERLEQRVARALLRLAHQAGKPLENGILIDLPLSRQDIAEMTGTNLYSVSRILSNWEKQGIIEGGRERIVLSDPHRVVVIAEDLPSTP